MPCMRSVWGAVHEVLGVRCYEWGAQCEVLCMRCSVWGAMHGVLLEGIQEVLVWIAGNWLQINKVNHAFNAALRVNECHFLCQVKASVMGPFQAVSFGRQAPRDSHSIRTYEVQQKMNTSVMVTQQENTRSCSVLEHLVQAYICINIPAPVWKMVRLTLVSSHEAQCHYRK